MSKDNESRKPLPLRETQPKWKPEGKDQEESSEIIRDVRIQNDPPLDGPESRDPSNPAQKRVDGKADLETEDEQETLAELVEDGKERADDEQRNASDSSLESLSRETELRDD